MNDTPEAVDLNAASDDDLKQMGLPPAFTLDELKSFMTEEEIERELASDDPVVKVEKAADEAGPEEDLAADESADQPGDVAAVAAEEEEDVQPPAPSERDPVIRQIDVSQHEAVIQNFTDERKKLREAWNDGDLSDAEFDEKLDELSDQRAEAQTAIKIAQSQIEADQQAWAEAWYDRNRTFMESNPAFNSQEAIDKLDGNSVFQLFDAACKHVNSQPSFAHMSHAQRLAQAERMTRDIYKDRVGEDLAKPEKSGANKEKKTEQTPQTEKTPAQLVAEQGKRAAPVQTLGGISSASETELGDGRFSAIDSAQGLDAERAYAQLSPAEQEAFLAGY